MPPVEAVLPGTGRARDPASPTRASRSLALAFKVIQDSHRGPVVLFRVYSGVLHVRDQILNVARDKKERINKLLLVLASKTEEIEEVGPGNIAAAVGLRFTTTGDTLILSKDKNKVVLPGMTIPEPVIFRSVEAKSTADQKDLELRRSSGSKKKIPASRVYEDPDSAQTLMAGQGELHLEVIVNKLERDYRVKARVGKPQVAYRESIAAAGPQSNSNTRARPAASGNTPRSPLELVPRERGTGNRSRTRCPRPTNTSNSPRNSSAAALEGMTTRCRGARCWAIPSSTSTRAWSPPTTSTVTRTWRQFRAAATMGMNQAIEGATPRLLEPVMIVEVVGPDEFIGNVHSDLNSSARPCVGSRAPWKCTGRPGPCALGRDGRLCYRRFAL